MHLWVLLILISNYWKFVVSPSLIGYRRCISMAHTFCALCLCPLLGGIPATTAVTTLVILYSGIGSAMTLERWEALELLKRAQRIAWQWNKLLMNSLECLQASVCAWVLFVVYNNAANNNGSFRGFLNHFHSRGKTMSLVALNSVWKAHTNIFRPPISHFLTWSQNNLEDDFLFYVREVENH